MSGHSKWSTIKHKKGAVDAKRGKLFTKLIKEVTVAARTGGGDINGNPRLRRAVDAAKEANMPADNVTRAIKKGTGELEGAIYEELRYEGVGPGATLLVVNVATDNRNRTAADIRKIFDKHGGQLGASGSAAWAFDELGCISLPKDASTEEQLIEIAGEAGAEDVALDDDCWHVTTPFEALDQVQSALSARDLPVEEASHRMIPKNPKSLQEEDSAVLEQLIEVLDDHDDVQTVFTDAE